MEQPSPASTGDRSFRKRNLPLLFQPLRNGRDRSERVFLMLLHEMPASHHDLLTFDLADQAMRNNKPHRVMVNRLERGTPRFANDGIGDRMGRLNSRV